MKSCITTVIKNEHEYLDEWIKYHLDLGIDYIFIFEDIDSNSHKEITDKYDNVLLENITFLFSEKGISKIHDLKTRKNANPQHMYFKGAVNYIKKKYDFDWCFVIDNDEFITLEEGKTLNDVLNLYSEYDAFLMQWKCFGANGYINKPNYEKGTIETFTKEITGKLPDVPSSLVKTCYNLHTYNEKTLSTQHIPFKDCKWCKTDFSKNIEKSIYNNIYIRHYVTRSWEEWVWKIKTRGQFWGDTRHLDVFFKINTDMDYLKEQLISSSAKSCILTVVKNEQEYLKEWIDYHLNLGINYIFIIEDFDSESHEEIVKNYSNVILFRAEKFLNEKSFQRAVELKQRKGVSPQSLYFRIGLKYIKEKYLDVDWTFVIDNDEFLTLQSGKTLQDIFLEFQNYDAFVIQWQCFGANNLVFKPDYNKKGVIETYTEPMKGELLDRVQAFIKTCYNMHKYKKGYLYNMHHPDVACTNWCNTNHELCSYNPTYKNIYIRHYITRSLEEYIWKKESRGQNTRQDPDLKMFFTINPEMKDKKEEYLKMLRPETLVILPYIQTGAQGNEIKLCLNAWKKFCTFDYHFIVIGEFDESLILEFPWVEFIKLPKIEFVPQQYIPHLDIINKIRSLYTRYSSYQNFIYITDDEYAIKPFTLEDIKITHYLSKEMKGNQNAPANHWVHDLWKTKDCLLKNNLPIVNYCTHYPVYFNFNKLEEIVRKFKLEKESYVLENIYFNYFEHDDSVQVDSIRLGIWNNDIYKEHFQDALNNPDIKFICNSVNGWSEELEYELNNLINDGKTN